MERPLQEQLEKACSVLALWRSQIPLNRIRSDLPLSKQICFEAIPDFYKPCHRQTDEKLDSTSTYASHIEIAITPHQKGQQPTLHLCFVIDITLWEKKWYWSKRGGLCWYLEGPLRAWEDHNRNISFQTNIFLLWDFQVLRGLYRYWHEFLFVTSWSTKTGT